MIIFKSNKIPNETSVERIEASVKWYNPEKGYGFLNREDKLGDIMIHFSTLDKTGCPYIKVGDRVICDVASGKAGGQVSRVIEVKLGSPEIRSISSFLASQLTPIDPENLQEIEGIMKWYSFKKGYGFVYPDDGGQEIFLHSSVLKAAGYKYLEPGLRVLVTISKSERGREARMIIILDEKEVSKQAS